MDDFGFAELKSTTEQCRCDFLRVNLELCNTYIELAQTHLNVGDRQAAHRIFERAEIGHATIGRFLADVQNVKRRREIERQLTTLVRRLQSLKASLS